MFAERFGSYSIAATLAGTPSFVRLKSIWRKRRLCPPPLWRVVMRPLLFRPPVFFVELVGLFSGFPRVSPSEPDAGTKRRRRAGRLDFFQHIRPPPPRDVLSRC